MPQNTQFRGLNNDPGLSFVSEHPTENPVYPLFLVRLKSLLHHSPQIIIDPSVRHSVPVNDIFLYYCCRQVYFPNNSIPNLLIFIS